MARDGFGSLADHLATQVRDLRLGWPVKRIEHGRSCGGLPQPSKDATGARHPLFNHVLFRKQPSSGSWSNSKVSHGVGRGGGGGGGSGASKIVGQGKEAVAKGEGNGASSKKPGEDARALSPSTGEESVIATAKLQQGKEKEKEPPTNGANGKDKSGCKEEKNAPNGNTNLSSSVDSGSGSSKSSKAFTSPETLTTDASSREALGTEASPCENGALKVPGDAVAPAVRGKEGTPIRSKGGESTKGALRRVPSSARGLPNDSSEGDSVRSSVDITVGGNGSVMIKGDPVKQDGDTPSQQGRTLGKKDEGTSMGKGFASDSSSSSPADVIINAPDDRTVSSASSTRDSDVISAGSSSTSRCGGEGDAKRGGACPAGTSPTESAPIAPALGSKSPAFPAAPPLLGSDNPKRGGRPVSSSEITTVEAARGSGRNGGSTDDTAGVSGPNGLANDNNRKAAKRERCNTTEGATSIGSPPATRASLPRAARPSLGRQGHVPPPTRTGENGSGKRRSNGIDALCDIAIEFSTASSTMHTDGSRKRRMAADEGGSVSVAAGSSRDGGGYACRVTGEDGRVVEADAVIVTLPLGLLKAR